MFKIEITRVGNPCSVFFGVRKNRKSGISALASDPSVLSVIKWVRILLYPKLDIIVVSSRLTLWF